MATGITKRVSGAIAEGSTKRVAYNDAVLLVGGDTWNGSWANSWANSWSFVGASVSAAPALDVTKRVSGAITANITKRVTGV